MKVKKAIEILTEEGPLGRNKASQLSRLYHEELFDRMTLRVHGKDLITQSATEGVIKEMDNWIVKVAIGIGFTEEQAKETRQQETEAATSSMKLVARMPRRKRR